MSTSLMNHHIWIIHIKRPDFLEGHPTVATTYGILTMERGKVVKNSHEPREKNPAAWWDTYHSYTQSKSTPALTSTWPKSAATLDSSKHSRAPPPAEISPSSQAYSSFWFFLLRILVAALHTEVKQICLELIPVSPVLASRSFFRKEVTHPCTLCL